MDTTSYRAYKAAAERRTQLPTLLRTAAAAAGTPSQLMGEAADEIDRLNGVIKQMRADEREAERDARNEIRDAVAEERWAARERSDAGY